MDPGARDLSAPSSRTGRHTWYLRAAAAALWLDGLGFGVLVPPAIASVAAARGVPTVGGFPAYGEGPFESAGIPTTVPLLALFLLICGVQVVAGALVWRGRRAGAVLALLVLLPSAVFWWGFALPVGPVLGALWAALIVLGRPALRT
jgi:hypothetical protein